MAVLIDTNIFLASVFPKDVNHNRAKAALRELRTLRIVPAPVLPELFYMIKERVTYRDALQTFKLIRQGAFQIESLTAAI